MTYADPETGKARDRERFRKRSAARKAAGLCPRCGDRPPEPDRSVCAPCAEKSNRASRTRDARLRAEGKPRRDPARARAYERERSRRQAGERREAGLCIRCGTAPAAESRKSCEPCLEKRRVSDRANYAAGKAAGKLYGGASIDAKRRSARTRSKRRQKQRAEAGLCIRCGKRAPAEGGTTCTPCRRKRQAAERRQYADRRAAELCTRCGGAVHDGLSRCAPCSAIEEASKCPERKNARSRRLYWKRRATNLCTACGAPSLGGSRCPPCAKRSYERSAYIRVMPVYPPSYAVFLRGAEEPLAVLDDEMEVAAFLAFEKLGRDQVEIVADAPEIASWAAWS